MSIKKDKFFNYIKQFDFINLFNELGWDNIKQKNTILIDEINYNFVCVAEKKGFKVFVCENTTIPDNKIRRKLNEELTKFAQENLIIFIDFNKTEQLWITAFRYKNKPVKIVETRWNKYQIPELLYQRASNIIFSIDDEDNITIMDVSDKVKDGFHSNSEKVTTKFYKEFQDKHKSFANHIEGIDDERNKEWYSSLMLNRLMFCYFIQKKNFLDNDKNYLKNKLVKCQAVYKDDKFYTFYKYFLLKLFFDGLGNPHEKITELLGNIPYLNGGLFSIHEIEEQYQNINIKDDAFVEIFDFFDNYQWHLDTRANSSGNEINPDVLGYIFEKYINDRASMGAYYTKEDITEYISKNSIIPYLFDELKRNNVDCFDKDYFVYNYLKSSGDLYIYDSVKYGLNSFEERETRQCLVSTEINTDINAEKKHLFEIRKCWNKPANEEIGLPTETIREVIERRKKCVDVYNKIKNGEITNINDFITYNLNIIQFTKDIIELSNSETFIEQFYKALSKITILDPTCGSGAFLFAAMNILEPLYELLLVKMKSFKENEYFKYISSEINKHPNLQYFIYKSIILNNLFGVDIMKEAVEIAKLRLFLKLIATVEADYSKDNLGIEPLPDIDFNIKCGNTLIGFAKEDDLIKVLNQSLEGRIKKDNILLQCKSVACSFHTYKKLQIENKHHDLIKKQKSILINQLSILNDELNNLLHEKDYQNTKYEEWLKSHQPFHWFAEFYEIIQGNKGFDVIIGNPPYVEYSKVRDTYKLFNYETEKCGNLYAFVMERSNRIINIKGLLGMIIPLSGFCTERMEPLVKHYKKINEINSIWISHFGWRPSTLFDGVNIPLSIIISKPVEDKTELHLTEFIKWYNEKRTMIFDLLDYTKGKDILLHKFVFPKIKSESYSLVKKLLSKKYNLLKYTDKIDKNTLYYRNTGGLYWRIILNFKPYFNVNGIDNDSSTLTTINFKTEEYLLLATAILNSNIFWLYYVAYSSFHHVNPVDINSFPIDFDNLKEEQKNKIIELAKSVMKDMNEKSSNETRIHKGGKTSISQTFYPSKSKDIIDQIDIILAEHYGFTEEELDFIINYDIKYRMGKEEE